MVVPSTVGDLHKTNTRFYHASRHQALPSEIVCLLFSNAVKIKCRLRFLF